LYSDGTSAPRIIGIPLNGDGTALIRDTDHGALDGDTVYDHAVGPMQFIPSTWATWGVDGNGDGVISPFNIYDAALAAADYLCAAGGDLRTSAGQVKAVLTYNDSAEYLSTVLGLEKVYAAGVPGVTIPVLPVNPQPPPNEKPVLPPADPGRPPGLPPLSTKPSAHSGSSSGSNSGTHSGSSSGSNPGSPGGSTSGPTGGSTTPTDAPPTVRLKVTSKTGAPHDITVDASGSTDDHGITGYSYDFGDGSKAVSGSANSAEYVYPKAGWFVVTVTATDSAGHQGKATVRVLIDTPPKADLQLKQADGSLVVTADATASTDVGGMGIANYVIDFGDKTGPVTVDAGKTHDHPYAAAGDYTVTLTVVDAAGKSTTVTKPITVTAPSSTTTPSDTTSAGTGTGTGTSDSTAGGSTSADPSASTS
jgi:PKD repeat protein